MECGFGSTIFVNQVLAVLQCYNPGDSLAASKCQVYGDGLTEQSRKVPIPGQRLRWQPLAATSLQKEPVESPDEIVRSPGFDLNPLSFGATDLPLNTVMVKPAKQFHCARTKVQAMKVKCLCYATVQRG